MYSSAVKLIILIGVSTNLVLCSPSLQDPSRTDADAQQHQHSPLPHAFTQTHHEHAQNLTMEHHQAENETSKMSAREAPLPPHHKAEHAQNLTMEHHKAENETSKILSARQAPFPPPGVPPPVGPGMPGMFPGGFGGLVGLGGGLGGGLDFGLDAGLGGGILGGILPYFPIIEKVIIIVGGGILLLLLLALVHGLIWNKEGLLGSFGLGLSGSKAVAGAANLDLGPVHASTAGSVGAGASLANNAHFNDRVQQGINQRF